MQLKDYQVEVLECVSRYLDVLGTKRERAEKIQRFLAEQGESAEIADYCREAWDALHNSTSKPFCVPS